MPLPEAPGLDQTLALAGDPYRWMGRTAAALGADAFEARLIGERTLCLTGRAGAALFYDTERMSREGAAPAPIAYVLFGRGAIHGLDDVAHRHRKALYLDLLHGGATDAWEAALRRAGDRMLDGLARRGASVREAASLTIMRAAMDWAGIELSDEDLPRRAQLYDRVVRHAGDIGPGFLLGVRARARADAWARDLIRAARAEPDRDTPLSRIARWTDETGARLPERTAATALQNATRPAVATFAFVEHLAHALHAHPGDGDRAARDAAHRHGVVQEVRRLYPFVPLLPARARRDFSLRGTEIPAGTRALIDIWGTARDPGVWHDPTAFRPERHRAPSGPFDMMPQGGGGHATGHRCPGEWATIRIMEVWAEWLTTRLRWRAGDDPSLDMGKFLAPPRTPFVLTG